MALIQDGDADAALALIAGTPVLRLVVVAAGVSVLVDGAPRLNIPLPHSESMVFEQAYCLFRQRKFEASLKLVNSVSEPSPALLELRAQLVGKAPSPVVWPTSSPPPPPSLTIAVSPGALQREPCGICIDGGGDAGRRV